MSSRVSVASYCEAEICEASFLKSFSLLQTGLYVGLPAAKAGLTRKNDTTSEKLYWHLRQTRNPSMKPHYYRYIEVEKKRLIEETGVDPEELRLLCRTLARQLNLHAESRLERYRKTMKKTSQSCENFSCSDCV